jgi:hypothetical protein
MRGLLLVVTAWAITVALGLVIVGQATGSSPKSTDSAGHAMAPGLGWNGKLYPLGPPGSGAAEKMTVAEAQTRVGFPVRMPRIPAAIQADLTQAWVSTRGRQIALVFDRGRVDITMAPAQYVSALRNFQAFIAEKSKNKVTAAIKQMNGQPALVITRDTSAICHCNPAYIEFDRSGIDVNISSHTYETSTLLAIAKSMH